MIERERFQVVSWMRAKRGVLLNEGDGDMMCLPVIEGPSRPQEHRLVTYIRSTDSAGITIFARIEYTSNVNGGRVQIQLVGVDGIARCIHTHFHAAGWKVKLQSRCRPYFHSCACETRITNNGRELSAALADKASCSAAHLGTRRKI